MRNRYVIYLVFLFFAICCKKNSNNEINKKNVLEKTEKVSLIFKGNDTKYLLNPSKSDSLCIKEIEKAKKDITKYKGVYVQTICFGCKSKP
jgi:hypothetical protein